MAPSSADCIELLTTAEQIVTRFDQLESHATTQIRGFNCPPYLDQPHCDDDVQQGRLVDGITYRIVCTARTLDTPGSWASVERAIPLSPEGPVTTEAASPSVEQRLVTLLAADLGDEAIARAMEVSLSTVQRRVRDLLQRVGARSRFQAGLQVGLRSRVPDSAPPCPATNRALCPPTRRARSSTEPTHHWLRSPRQDERVRRRPPARRARRVRDRFVT